MSNRMVGSINRKPRVENRPVRDCNIETQQDELFCSTCGCRWEKGDDFKCPTLMKQ